MVNTDGITLPYANAIPLVSDSTSSAKYHAGMEKNPERTWGQRIKAAAKAAGRTRQQIADHMDVHYSEVGHWQNGTRDIYLGKLFKLCEFVKADPRYVIFEEMTVDAAIATLRRPVLQIVRNTEAPPPLPKIPALPVKARKVRKKPHRREE